MIQEVDLRECFQFLGFSSPTFEKSATAEFSRRWKNQFPNQIQMNFQKVRIAFMHKFTFLAYNSSRYFYHEGFFPTNRKVFFLQTTISLNLQHVYNLQAPK